MSVQAVADRQLLVWRRCLATELALGSAELVVSCPAPGLASSLPLAPAPVTHVDAAPGLRVALVLALWAAREAAPVAVAPEAAPVALALAPEDGPVALALAPEAGPVAPPAQIMALPLPLEVTLRMALPLGVN